MKKNERLLVLFLKEKRDKKYVRWLQFSYLFSLHRVMIILAKQEIEEEENIYIIFSRRTAGSNRDDHSTSSRRIFWDVRG